MSKVINELLYSESHEWVKVDGDIATIGVSDFAQKEMGDITYVEMPEEDDEIEAGEEFGALESVKASSELLSPLTGVITEVNEVLEDEPELINEDSYANWIVKIRMKDKTELDELMSAGDYKKMTEEE